MPWGAVAAIGGAVIGAVAQNNAANKGAKATKDANNAAIAEQRAAREQYQQNIEPWLTSGGNALTQLNALNSGDYSSFHESPDYQFTLDQGLKIGDRSAAANGALFSGGHQADLAKYAEGLASQQYNNYYDKLYNLAGMGQNAAVGAGSAAMQSANNIGGYLSANGQAAANAAYQQGNALAGLAGAAGNAFGQWYGQRSSYQQPTYTPSTVSTAGATGFGNNTGWLTDGSYGGGYNGWGP